MPRRRRRRKRTPENVMVCEPKRRTFFDLPEHLMVDQLIRSLGFCIHSRRAGKPTWWMKNGSTYSQDEILAYYVSQEAIWEMEYSQMMEAALAESGDGIVT